ncbi:hypothetical protein ABW20_dc0105768 [Dactylellina cionopaga]|nr:hypothetical protein ABW20_dc0105768 [Dactylellina cionopaga]
MPALTEIQSSQPYTAISTYLSSDKPLDPANLTTIVNSLKEPITSSSSSSSIATYLETLWNSILIFAARSSYEYSDSKHVTLLGILDGLQNTEASQEAEGEKIVYNDTPFTWSSLPDFAMYVREWYNFSPSSSPSPPSPIKEMEFGVRQWMYFNGFLARLTHYSLCKDTETLGAFRSTVEAVDPLDYSLYAFWSLRELETKPTPDDIPIVEFVTAALWVYLAGPSLFRLATAEKSYEGNLGVGRGVTEHMELKGWTNGRWEFWRVQLENRDSGAGLGDNDGDSGEDGEEMPDGEAVLRRALNMMTNLDDW